MIDMCNQIYLELARARLTGMLASHHEALAETAPEASSSFYPLGSQRTVLILLSLDSKIPSGRIVVQHKRKGES